VTLNRVPILPPSVGTLAKAVSWPFGDSHSSAQGKELSPEERATLLRFTSQFRFNSDLKVGDWVKYRYTAAKDSAREIELKVTGEENGSLWIVETLTSQNITSAIHLLVNLTTQEFSQIFIVNEKGEKQNLPVLSLEQFYTKISDMMTRASEQGALPPFGWRKGADLKEITAGSQSFTCEYLEPDIEKEEAEGAKEIIAKEAKSRLGLSRIKELVEKPENIGDVLDIKDKVESVSSVEGLKSMVDKPDLDDLFEIAEAIATSQPKDKNVPPEPLFFSEKVPRLIPYEIILGFFMFTQPFNEVQGGLVKSGSLELAAWGKGGL
jgi:hypothetical protein